MVPGWWGRETLTLNLLSNRLIRVKFPPCRDSVADFLSNSPLSVNRRIVGLHVLYRGWKSYVIDGKVVI